MPDLPPGWTPQGVSEEDNLDGEAYHRSLYEGGRLERLAGWHRRSVEPLVDLAIRHIKDGDLVVDYGAGTGGSALELLKALDARGIRCTLVLVDPLPSWLSKAWSLLRHRDDVRCYLSMARDPETGRMTIRPLRDLLGGRLADMVVSSSTFHLIPSRALPGAMVDIAEALRTDGVLAWDSGDVDDPERDPMAALMHDPYRCVRRLVEEDPAYEAMLADLPEAEARRVELTSARIFPEPPDLATIASALASAGFSDTFTSHLVRMSTRSARRFILVPRLTGIAGACEDVRRRRRFILEHFERAMDELRARGQADEHGYRSHWTYGVHRKCA